MYGDFFVNGILSASLIIVFSNALPDENIKTKKTNESMNQIAKIT